jgi:DNA invertase Pin-like site-specific DNA recombinase
MKRAVIYARYSSSSQTEQSIEGQIRVCSEYAKAKNLQIVGEYVDRAISGRNADNRPEFQRLMQDCGKHLFEAVIVYRTDRFARNKYDSAIYKRHLKKTNVELHYAAEHIPEGPEGIILESLMEGLAEYYSAELSQKIRRGIRESALKGHATGGNIALGYKVAPDKSFAIDEKEAEAVRIIFDMFVRQKPSAEICEYLNGLGIKTSRGQAFSKSSVPRIIQNEKYIGVYKCGDIRIEDAVPPIISREVFLVAQKENARRRTSKQAALPRAEYLLSGKLFCGHCKKKMTGVSGTGKQGGKFYYYYCSSARYKKRCDKKQVPKNRLEDLVVAETLDHILKPDAVKHIANACYEIQLNDKSGDEEVEFFRSRIAENKKALDNTLRAIESGVETTTLPLRLKELELERLQLTDGLKNAEARRIVLTPEHIEFMLLQYAEKGEDEQAYKKEIIECFVSEVYLYDDRLLIYYNINKNQPALAQSDLALAESNEFDQRALTSTIIFLSKEVDSEENGLLFVCDIEFKKEFLLKSDN